MAPGWLKRARGENAADTRASRVDLVALDREFGIALDERGRTAMTLAGEEAIRSKHTEIGAEHLIVGVVAADGPAAQLLAGQGLTLEDVRSQVSEALVAEQAGRTSKLGLSAESHGILQVAAEAAGIRGRQEMAPEHILYGVACAGFESTSRMLHALRVDRQALLRDVEPLLS
ncbi:MAG: Clp protease N-terminal domain-containing protein [Gaiellaceae bacterium]